MGEKVGTEEGKQGTIKHLWGLINIFMKVLITLALTSRRAVAAVGFFFLVKWHDSGGRRFGVEWQIATLANHRLKPQ